MATERENPIIRTLIEAEQELHEHVKRPLETFSETFKPQHNETILSLGYLMLVNNANESTEEWIGSLRVKAIECKYQETDRN